VEAAPTAAPEHGSEQSARGDRVVRVANPCNTIFRDLQDELVAFVLEDIRVRLTRHCPQARGRAPVLGLDELNHVVREDVEPTEEIAVLRKPRREIRQGESVRHRVALS